MFVTLQVCSFRLPEQKMLIAKFKKKWADFLLMKVKVGKITEKRKY